MSKKVLNPFPKYLQLRDALLRRLERDYAVGDKLPTEHELREEFGVSRETVRDALDGLQQDGLIKRVRGQGTFIMKLPRPRSEKRMTGLAEDFTALKFDTEARVIEKGLVTPPVYVAELMPSEPDEVVYRIVRLRLFSREHFAHHEAYLPLDIGARVARLDLGRTSIMHELTETLGHEIWEDHQRIEAVLADVDMAALLRVPVNSALLCITRHFLTTGGKTIVVFRSHYRADRYYYTVKIAQDADDPALADAPARGLTGSRDAVERQGDAAAGAAQ